MSIYDLYQQTHSMINGIPVFINDGHLGLNIKRSWEERLFSLPWKPLLKYYFDPEKGDYLIATDTIIKSEQGLHMNKITFNKIINAINSQIDNDIMKFPYEK